MVQFLPGGAAESHAGMQMTPDGLWHELNLQEGWGGGEGGSSKAGEEEATTQVVAALSREKAAGLGADHGVPLHLGREGTDELTVCPPAPHQDFLGFATGGPC